MSEDLRARLTAFVQRMRATNADGQSVQWWADQLAALLREPPEIDPALPKRNARELAQALRDRAFRLSGQEWELPATVAMMREAADLLERVAAAPEDGATP